MGTPAVAYAAGRDITIGGVAYKRGQPVVVDDLLPRKVAQFLNQRILRPVAPVAKDVGASR